VHQTEPAPITPPASKDFELQYAINSDDILPTFIDEPVVAAKGNEEEGNFLLFVTPPMKTGECKINRKMFFLLDRSGSMTGEPYVEATRALLQGLQTIKASDHFAIILFDHTVLSFPPEGGMLSATAANVELAEKWISSIRPQNGGTDIGVPMRLALDTLLLEEKKDPQCLPFVCLITDGCVEAEREICRNTAKHSSKARVLSFGIGSYCNWSFLKMLSQLCRGFSDVVVYKEHINTQILRLLNMASHPVLTDIKLAIGGGKSTVCDVELYPFPMPDLFKGSPLTVTGKYKGKLPSKVGLMGTGQDGTEIKKAFSVRTSDVIPVSKVFIKQRIELLSAKAWLEESQEAKAEVVELSCDESIPSPYTVMVAVEETEEVKKMMAEEEEEENKDAEGDQLLGGGAKKKLKKKWYQNKATIAALVAGNVAIVGALAFSFGDLAGTAANIPGIGELFQNLGNIDLGCCECCGGGCEACGNCLKDCNPADCLIC